MVRADSPDSPSTNRMTLAPSRGRRCWAMKASTSAVVTSAGSLSTTVKNARRSDAVDHVRRRAAPESEPIDVRPHVASSDQTEVNQLAKESQDNCSLRCRSDGSVDAFRQVNRREEFCEVVNAEDKKPVGR